MNKKDIIKYVSRVTCAKGEAKDAVNVFIETIQKALQTEDKVVIQGLGTFTVHRRTGRIGRNPRTGEAVQIAPRKAVHFKASKILMHRMSSHDRAS